MNAPRLHRPARPVRQTGMTLIELMVAVLMALFMAAALLFIYAGMRNSYLTQDRLAQLQDSQRVALSVLGGTLEQAGYFVSPTSDTIATALVAGSITWQDNTVGNFAAGQALTGVGNGSGRGKTSDAVSVRFQTADHDGLLNCTGSTNLTGGKLVYTNTLAINDSNELTCSVNGAPPVPLVSNVGKMQIIYGTDTLNHAAVDSYLSAQIISSQNLWSRVHSVKIRLYFMDTTKNPPALITTPVLQTISLQNLQ